MKGVTYGVHVMRLCSLLQTANKDAEAKLCELLHDANCDAEARGAAIAQGRIDQLRLGLAEAIDERDKLRLDLMNEKDSHSMSVNALEESLASQTAKPRGNLAAKYDDVLIPFVERMRHELHANSGKGDREGWLSMSPETCLLELFYHMGKLQKAVKDVNPNAKGADVCYVAEHAADVANLAMMMVDLFGALVVESGRAAPGSPDDSKCTLEP